MHLTDFDFEPKVYPIVNTKYRTIQTKVPVQESISFFERIEKYEPRSMHGALPILWDKAEGFQLYDSWGNKWIDFTSTIFVANAGHAHPHIIDAIKQQLDRPLIHTYNYLTKIRTDYLEYLINSTPTQFEKAYLVSTGSEATEAALKLMRMYSREKNENKLGIICFKGNYHGRTMGSQMMSYSPEQKEWIGYHDPNIFHISFPYPWNKKANENPIDYFYESMNQLVEKYSLNPSTDLCGFMIESFQGWGSVFYPKEYLNALEEFAHENEMLVCYDEMQAGFGRTGKLFGYMHYDVKPDLICCGKGVSSGFPLGIVLGPKRILDLPSVGSMSSTNSANPLACAAGLANLKIIIEEGLIEHAELLGNILQKKLNEIMIRHGDYISHILGKGLVAAVHFNQGNKPLVELANKICIECMGRGLLVVRTGRESIKLGPPLCISEEALLEGLDVLDKSISTIIE